MKYLLYFALVFSIVSCQQPSTNQEKQIELKIKFDTQESPVNSSIRGISVLDSNVIWLSGAKGNVLRTINGGKLWEKLTPPDNDSLDFRDVEAFSDSEAIVISAGYPSRVYRTNDGGNSWELVYENKDSASFMNSVAFKNKNEGVILGDQLKGRHLILRSGDSGKNWKRIDSLDVPKPLTMENGFAASGSCIAINQKGNFFIGLGGEQSRIFSSINGFKWKAKSTPMISGDGASGIYSIAYGNEKLMAVGGNYLYPNSAHYPIVSLNNGKSWIKAKGKVNGYRSIVDYSKPQKLWVCGGSNGLDLSYDGGAVWTKFSDENINTLQFIPKTSKAIAANGKGEIFLLDIQLTISKD